MASTLHSFVNSFNNKLEPPVRQHLKNVYGCLSLSALSAAAGAYVHMYTHFLQAGLLSSLGALGLIYALLITPDTAKYRTLRISYLGGFTFLTGLGLGPLLELVVSINPSIVLTALIGTAVVFVSFSISSLLSARGQWLYLGGTLISLLNVMLLISLANIFRFQLLDQINLYLGLFVMCGFVIYDTQLIVEKNRNGSKDYIAHSLDLFIDFIHIFRHLLIILTQKEQKNNKRKE